MVQEKYYQCIGICNECAVICENCADECLHENGLDKLVRCIELDRTCADMCRMAAVFMSRGSEFAESFCALCAEVCQACGDECENHKHMEHCQECAYICHRCAEACRGMAGVRAGSSKGNFEV